MFRWTIKELKELSDLRIIRGVLAERKGSCTSIYSPLYKKLTELYAKVDCAINHGQATIE
jgi:hypothetical protein